jgi:hypothetical protein
MATIFLVLAIFTITGQPVTAALYNEKSYASKDECKTAQPDVVATLNGRLALKGMTIQDSKCMTQEEIDEFIKKADVK